MTENGSKESRVVCANSQGLQLSGPIIQLGQNEVIFEIYSPAAVIQASEVLQGFKIELKDRTAYSGRAVVKNVVHTEVKIVCSAAFDGRLELRCTEDDLEPAQLQRAFKKHQLEWQELCLVRPEYKLHLADMESYFAELRLWLDQVELGIRAGKTQNQIVVMDKVARQLGTFILPSVNALFEKFEFLVEELEPERRAMQRTYMQRRLHPLLLCAPFLHRTFIKPLGYAGDYEMVNMIAREQPGGESLYAKVIDYCFLRQPPAAAHRNRLTYLENRLVEETVRVASQGRTARIFSMACGPAFEVQSFLSRQELSNRAEFTLLDFNEETIEHVKATLAEIKAKFSRRTPVQFVKRSVHHLLKESARSSNSAATEQYDFVYCAGLFDYLTDAVCQRLVTLMYGWVAPGGLLLVTNVDATLNEMRAFRHSLDFLLDWQLIFRRNSQIRELALDSLDGECSVKADDTGVNLFLELRKPHNG